MRKVFRFVPREHDNVSGWRRLQRKIQFFAIKLRVRSLQTAEDFTVTQTDTPVAETCKYTEWLLRYIEVRKYVSVNTITCGTPWHSWLRHCATSRKVADSITESGFTENFHWHNSSGFTTVIGSTQTLTAISNRKISWWVKRVVLAAENVTIFLCRLS